MRKVGMRRGLGIMLMTVVILAFLPGVSISARAASPLDIDGQSAADAITAITDEITNTQLSGGGEVIADSGYAIRVDSSDITVKVLKKGTVKSTQV